MDYQWLEIAKKLEAIAQAGLTYGKDDYDKERYQEVRAISHRIFERFTNAPMERIENLFANETGYPTPKVDIRGVIFQDEKVLLVQEKLDGLWALPGGWADIGLTPGEVVVKEVREEAGLDVMPARLLAVFDKKCHDHPPSPLHVYKLFILCTLSGGTLKAGMETLDARFFHFDDLPDLSVDRNTDKQLKTMFELYRESQSLTLFD